MSVQITAEADEIVVDGKPYKLTNGVVNFQDIATFAPKSTIGDYSRDSNPLTSSWVITDLSGGHGVVDLEEGADAGRYRFGVVDARRPRQITCPMETAVYVGDDLGFSTGLAYPLGAIDGNVYALYGSTLVLWDETTKTFADTGDTLTGAPTNKPTVWSRGGATEYFYIPLGSDGYATYDGSTVAPISSPDAIDFLVWDNKLLCIDDDGKLWQTTDGTTWDDFGGSSESKLDKHVTPRQLLVYFDRNDEYVPYLITDQEVHAIDMAGPIIYRTELYWPRHRDMGLGACNWRGDMHVAVGMGVFRYNGSIISPIGLDRDQGLPTQYRGRIVDLLAAYNSMYALVSGEENEEMGEEIWAFDDADDEWYISPSTTVSSLHEFTGIGWHCLWTTTEPLGNPSWSLTTCEDDTYRLWWGVGNTINVMKYPIDFANARAIIESGQYRFAPYAWLETGRFDAAMEGYTKLGEGDLLRATVPEGCRIDVSYKIDGAGGYTFLQSITESGTAFKGLGDLLDVIAATEGSPFNDVELLFEWFGTGATAPILESNVLTYIKLNKSATSLNANVDLSAKYKGRSPVEMRRALMALNHVRRFFSVTVDDDQYRMRIASISGGQFSGAGDKRSQVILSLIEVPAGLSEDNT